MQTEYFSLEEQILKREDGVYLHLLEWKTD